jgi:hypothetical protein
MYVTVLEKVARRYAPSRTLSFDVVHVFAALQICGTLEGKQECTL